MTGPRYLAEIDRYAQVMWDAWDAGRLVRMVAPEPMRSDVMAAFRRKVAGDHQPLLDTED